jgi:POT family proton-dependent oligopeptide transporter
MTSRANQLPPQIKYIIGNEGCERFSFYGMKNILTFFMINYLLLSEPAAKANYHLFVSACYFFPLLGGWLSDRFFGKYRTILYLSIIYCFGHLLLALFDTTPTGFYAGLGLIALGSGGIKPCVSAHVGDQFTEHNRHLVKQVFALFYWIINFGSFFASLLIPLTLQLFGAQVAFGIPGVLMAIATFVFWLGRDHYVHVPPTGKNPHGFFRVLASALRAPKDSRPVLERALDKHPEEAVDGVRAVFRVMKIFAPIPVFWALFDQKGSSWVVQATAMDREIFGFTLAPSQILALNPLLVMLLIPLNQLVIYPALERRGTPLSPLGRMTAGMFIACSAFLAVAALQYVMDAGATPTVLWQAGPYLLLTLAEVLVSTTGLEFAYSQAPRAMKSTIMSFWNLTVTIGNLITATISALNVFEGGTQYLFYALLVLASACVFAVLARGFVVRDYFQNVKA